MTGSVVRSYVWYERPVNRGSLGRPRFDLIMNKQSVLLVPFKDLR